MGKWASVPSSPTRPNEDDLRERAFPAALCDSARLSLSLKEKTEVISWLRARGSSFRHPVAGFPERRRRRESGPVFLTSNVCI